MIQPFCEDLIFMNIKFRKNKTLAKYTKFHENKTHVKNGISQK